MEKIIKALLVAKFPNANIEALLEVVNATPNAEVATEILCGLYEDPILPQRVKSGASDEEGYRTLISYDKFKQQVRFSVNEINSETLYFKTQEEADACSTYKFAIEEAKAKTYYNRGDNAIQKKFVKDIKPYERTCELSTWLSDSKRFPIEETVE